MTSRGTAGWSQETPPPPTAETQDLSPDSGASEPPAGQDLSPRPGHLVQVELPITAAVQEQVEATIRRIAENAPPAQTANERTVVVLEFDTSNGRDGRGSRLGSSADLARFLLSNEVSQLEFVAYVPAPKTFADVPGGAAQPESELVGHAVLVALACNHIALHENAALGRAGLDEPAIDEGLRSTYRQIASKRLVFPVEFAISMLDPDASLYRADLGEGKFLFVDRQQLRELETQGKVLQSDTLTEQGSLPLYNSQLLAKYQLLRHRIRSRRDLADRFRLTPDALEGDPTLGGDWHAVELPIAGRIDQRSVNWIAGSLRQLPPETNLILVTLDTEGGDPAQCIRLASMLADFDSNRVRTVAYIPSRAAGISAIVPLACDHLVMGPAAILGGPDTRVPSVDLASFREIASRIAEKTGRDWSLPLAVLDPQFAAALYSHRTTGQVRILSEQQLGELGDEAVEWTLVRPLETRQGISGTTAESLFVARYLADDLAQLKSLYQIKSEPRVLEPTAADRWVESLARHLGTPWVAAWLLFGAMFFLSTEMSSPGVGVPGFIGSLCLVLYFWSQYCNGNANWLEILLFVVGVAFLALELFVLPGFGIFGIGGVLMIFSSLVLASQTFVIPRTSEDFDRLPVSLSMVVAAGSGFLIAIFFLRRYLAQLPFFKRLMLEPPAERDELLSADQREALVNYQHLLKQTGTTITRLAPSGRARFGNQFVDVISDGDLVESGQKVVVIEVAGNRVVVRAK